MTCCERRIRPLITTILSLILGISISALCNAENHALLIGVGKYPSLPSYLHLSGPKNDVSLLREVLRQRGFKRENIVVLADQVRGAKKPTRQAIVTAMNDLERIVAAGDYIYLHFSGHGSRQPQGLHSQSPEPDGLDEIFLPYDIGRWDGEIGTVANAIVDNEINVAVAKLRKKGAFVWAVFDTCHAGTMIRGKSKRQIKQRSVAPDQLGIPRTGKLQDIREPDTVPLAENSAATVGGYIAFYASQSHELTAELALPVGHPKRKIQGIFSYFVAEILASSSLTTYRQAADRILQKYRAENITESTPLFEGTHLDAAMLGTKNQARAMQWVMQLDTHNPKGNPKKLPRINAGSLHRVGEGAVFAILAQANQEIEHTIGYARAVDVKALSATLKPVAYADKPAVGVRQLPNNAYARLVDSPISLNIHTAIPAISTAKTKAQRSMLRSIRIRRDNKDQKNIVKWVSNNNEAELRISFTPSHLQKSCADHAESRLWLLPRDGTLSCSLDDRRRFFSISLDQPTENVVEQLTDALWETAVAINLHRIEANRNNDTLETLDFEFQLEQQDRGGNELSALTKKAGIPHVRQGDDVLLTIKNRGASSVDLSVLFINSQNQIQSLFPRSGELNRIEPGAVLRNLGGTISSNTLGTELLYVIAVEAEQGSIAADFSFLVSPGNRAIRGADNQFATKLSALHRLLLRNAHGGSRGARQAGFGVKRARIKSFRWQVVR